MNTFIKIAGIPICLKDIDFLGSLNSIEMDLLEPFIIKSNSYRLSDRRLFLIKPIMIRNADTRKGCKVNPKFFKTTASFFPKYDDKRFKEAFRYFKDIYLPFSLNRNGLKKRKLITMFRDANTSDRGNIILGSLGCVISDRNFKEAYIIYLDRKSYPDFISYRFLYNLNILKLVLKGILNSKRDGIMLHASSIKRHGCGYTFVGRSSSGKSTVIELLDSKKVFSDDITIIRKVNSKYKIFPSPWWNYENELKTRQKRHAVPLQAIFFIKKARKTAMRRLGFIESMQKLLFSDHRFQQLGCFDDKAGLKRIYLFSKNLLEEIPSFELKVKKGSDFQGEFETLLEDCLKNLQ